MEYSNAIVFDLDGTLIDSAPDVAEALNRTLNKVGRSRLPLETIRTFIGHGARNMIQESLEATGDLISDCTIDDMVGHFLDFYKEEPTKLTKVYPGVYDVLNEFSTRNLRLGICTNKPAVMTRIVLDTLKLTPYFCGVTAGDDVEYQKPDGRHILETLNRMDATTEGAVMVGDSESDMAAAYEAGVGAIAVSYGYFSDSINEKYIDQTIDNMIELPATLEKIRQSS